MRSVAVPCTSSVVPRGVANDLGGRVRSLLAKASGMVRCRLTMRWSLRRADTRQHGGHLSIGRILLPSADETQHLVLRS